MIWTFCIEKFHETACASTIFISIVHFSFVYKWELEILQIFQLGSLWGASKSFQIKLVRSFGRARKGQEQGKK